MSYNFENINYKFSLGRLKNKEKSKLNFCQVFKKSFVLILVCGYAVFQWISQIHCSQ